MKKQVDKIDPIRSKFGKIEKESVTLADRMHVLSKSMQCFIKNFRSASMLESQQVRR